LKRWNRKATRGADGYWRVSDVHPGRRHVRIDALTDFQKITLEHDFEMSAP
jgi:hypothetical protein